MVGCGLLVAAGCELKRYLVLFSLFFARLVCEKFGCRNGDKFNNEIPLNVGFLDNTDMLAVIIF